MAKTLTKQDVLSHPMGVLVALNGYIRLTWKGEPPQVPYMVTDMDGTIWVCHVDFQAKSMKVEKRMGCYDDSNGKTTTSVTITPDDFAGLSLPCTEE